MPDEPYTLSDLASLADVTPRTIRYYVAQGLLPSPDAAGPATRYGEGHLVRLRLIKRLQRDHLPLSEIRARLERMGEDEIERLLNEAPALPEPPAPEETLAFVQNLLADAGVRPRTAAGRSAPPAGDAASGYAPMLQRRAEYHPMTPDSFPQPPEPGPVAPPVSPPPVQPRPVPPVSPSIPVAPGSTKAPDRSTWERLAVTPDVELHIRRPLDRLTNKKVDHLVRIARELFDEES